MKPVRFVCIDNAGRNQMTEAFAQRLGVGWIETCPAGSVNPRAIALMAERGDDRNVQGSMPLSVFEGQTFDAGVTGRCCARMGLTCSKSAMSPHAFIHSPD